jgi:hypothetical protein
MMITVGWLVGAVGILAEFPRTADHMACSLWRQAGFAKPRERAFALLDDVADVHADAERDATLGRRFPLLNDDRTADRVNSASKLGNRSVNGRSLCVSSVPRPTGNASFGSNSGHRDMMALRQ